MQALINGSRKEVENNGQKEEAHCRMSGAHKLMVNACIAITKGVYSPPLPACPPILKLIKSVVAERSSALDSSSDAVRMWVRIPAWPVAALVSLSKTLNHNCFVLRMGRKAVGPVCCVMHVKEPRTLIVKEKGLAPVFLDSRLEHPAGWICARYKSSVLLLLLTRNRRLFCFDLNGTTAVYINS